MTPRVVDASVLMMLFFAEEQSKVAERWFQRVKQPFAPDLIWSESANVVWKRRRSGDVNKEDALAISERISAVPLQVVPSADLISDALRLAIQFDRCVYDSIYLTLAVRKHGIMVSGDKRLINAMKGTELQSHIVWIGDDD